MNSKIILAAAVLAMTGAPAAFAQIGAPAVSQSSFYPGDVDAFHGGRDALTRAIDAVQSATGATVVDIRFARKDGTAGYHMVLRKDGRVRFMHVSDGAGMMELTSETVPAWMLSWNKRAQLRADRAASVTLDQAIRTAEDAQGASAIAAGIASSASNPDSDVQAYNVILKVNGRAVRVAVDSTTGQVIADPQALAVWG